MQECECLCIDPADHSTSLDRFDAIRTACPALRKIIIPDDIWDEYKQSCQSVPDEAFHRPIAYLAFQRGCLASLTGPIHKYCLDGSEPKATLRPQYKQDLVEKWIFQDTKDERFKKSRMFEGHLAELIFAQWLEQEGWNINGLEAHGENVDVLATPTNGDSCSFEIKHLGQEEILFDLGVEALQTNGTSAGFISVYSPVDYMLYRIYEAARQLEKVPNRKIVVMILTDFDIYYERPIQEEWIDWKAPVFFRRDNDITAFLDAKYKENPSLNNDMKHYISQIDEIWFFDKERPLTIRLRESIQI